MTEKQKLCRIVTIICHYDTIISLITIIIPIITKKDFFSAWHSLKKRGQQHLPSQGISVSSKQKHNRLNLEHQGALWRTGIRGVAARVGLSDVGKPAGAHGRTKLIAQVTNVLAIVSLLS